LKVSSRVVNPDWVSTDGCVDCCIEGDDPLAADAVVSFGPTASPSTEMEGEFAVEIRMGDPPVARERELA